jgi:GxxExxY protein
MNSRLLHHSLSEQLIGAFYDVYNELGYGFTENVYQRAMAYALDDRGVPRAREVPVAVYYKERLVGDFRADLIVDDRIVVECKSVPALASSHEKQILNYLAITGLQVGFLLNFGPNTEFRRFVMTVDRSRRRQFHTDKRGQTPTNADELRK